MLVLGTQVNVWILSASFVVAGAALSLLDLSWNLLVQEKVPEAMLSRIMAIDGFFSFVATPIGLLAVGPLAAAFGAQQVGWPASPSPSWWLHSRSPDAPSPTSD